jgi:hypothetical protein
MRDYARQAGRAMTPDDVNKILFGGEERRRRRYTQDTPVLPEVWFAFAAKPEARQDLLITPLEDTSANALLRELLDAMDEAAAIAAEPVALRGFVALKLTFLEFVQLILPRTQWAREVLERGQPTLSKRASEARRGRATQADDIQFLHLLGAIELQRQADVDADQGRTSDAIELGIGLLTPMIKARPGQASVWRVALNRRLDLSDEQARSTVKGDAAFRVFDARCADITWAVVDSGIDTEHDAFNDGGKRRVVASYDFTGLRALLNAGYRKNPAANPQLAAACAAAAISLDEGVALLTAAHAALKTDAMDWSAVQKLIHLVDAPKPADGHGTHVAGIIGANWRDPDDQTPIVVGLCPDIKLMDLRILADDLESTEFAVIGALQFIRYLNTRNQYTAVHGVNLSLSIPHHVENYACGRTPVCDECERLVGAGVVVVAAAGNQGYHGFTTAKGQWDGYATLSITDPGNAESVITVGSTHKREPHSYGVSYFSSRGPTGDGRLKPDLVAPGERIRSTLPGNVYGPLDGTSQAAPHVSAAAAILMARYPELVGQPKRVKQLLCESATDLGRQKEFQGHGLLDILRALQSF